MRAESGINPLDIKQKLYQQVAVRKKHLSLLQIFDRVAFDSFYFSQGRIDLQEMLFMCVAILYHDHPSKNQVTSGNADDIRKKVYSVNRRIITFLGNHNIHTNLT